MTGELDKDNGYNRDITGTNFAKIKGAYRVNKPLKNDVDNRPFLIETSGDFPSKNDVKKRKGEEKLSFQEWAEKYNQ